MIKQTWNINEDERNRILNLHESATKNLYLINEQPLQDVEKLNFPITNSFESGKFDLTDTSEIDDAINKIQDLLKRKEGSYDTIIINSSESKVPNEGVGLNPGDLSKKRAESTLKYIKSKLGNLVNVKINDLGSQGPEWDKSKGANHPDYLKHQIVSLTVSGEAGCRPINVNVTGGIGDESDDYIINKSVRKLNGIGFITFDTGSIPDRLVYFDDNKNIVYDSGYVATQPYENKDINYLPSNILTLTMIKNKGSIAVSGNKIIQQQISSISDLINLCFNNFKIKTFLLKHINDDKKIISILNNAYGRKYQISNAFVELIQLYNSGVSDFVLYDITNQPLKIPFDSKKGQKETSVYSPIGGKGLGETGYTLVSSCS